MRNVAEWSSVGAAMLRDEIVPRGEPAVLRGLVADWPAAEKGARSATELVDYLKRLDSGRPTMAIRGSPSLDGHLFYSDDMRGLNFERGERRVAEFLDELLGHLDDAEPPALAVQSLLADEAVPGFTKENPFPLPDLNGFARLWIGNSIFVVPHFDVRENIACVVAGRRRFTLFPPDQLPNLYLGPFDFSPAGSPVSMVDPRSPDLERFPRYRAAEAAAQVAELEPGDAIFIPYMWFHGVESLSSFNLLCNYWWNNERLAGSPFDVLMHAALVLRGLPEQHRRAWRGMLDHYVFEVDGDPFPHLRPQDRGALGGLDEAGTVAMKRFLARRLSS